MVLVSEIYLEYLISGVLNLISPETVTIADIASLIYAYECLFLSLIVLPLFILYSVVIPKEKYQDKDFMKKLGSFYEDNKTNNDTWEAVNTTDSYAAKHQQPTTPHNVQRAVALYTSGSGLCNVCV